MTNLLKRFVIFFFFFFFFFSLSLLNPDLQVDIFGVGCVAFFIWTGVHAFLRETDYLTWQAVLNDAMVIPSYDSNDLSDMYAKFVVAATQKDPKEREMINF